MFVTNHTLQGALVGRCVKSPGAAFAVGFITHFLADAVPHYGNPNATREGYYQLAKRDGLTGLATAAAVVAAAPAGRKISTIAGVAGACFPDLNKPSDFWFGKSFFPTAVDEFHVKIQTEHPKYANIEVVAAVVAGAVLVGLSVVSLRRNGKQKKAKRVTCGQCCCAKCNCDS
jgi:hypothetical protein